MGTLRVNICSLNTLHGVSMSTGEESKIGVSINIYLFYMQWKCLNEKQLLTNLNV